MISNSISAIVWVLVLALIVGLAVADEDKQGNTDETLDAAGGGYDRRVYGGSPYGPYGKKFGAFGIRGDVGLGYGAYGRGWGIGAHFGLHAGEDRRFGGYRGSGPFFG